MLADLKFRNPVVQVAVQAVSNIRTVASLGKERAFVAMYVDALEAPHKYVFSTNTLN